MLPGSGAAVTGSSPASHAVAVLAPLSCTVSCAGCAWASSVQAAGLAQPQLPCRPAVLSSGPPLRLMPPAACSHFVGGRRRCGGAGPGRLLHGAHLVDWAAPLGRARLHRCWPAHGRHRAAADAHQQAVPHRQAPGAHVRAAAAAVASRGGQSSCCCCATARTSRRVSRPGCRRGATAGVQAAANVAFLLVC